SAKTDGSAQIAGQAMDRRSRQAPQLAATWIVGAITERLASRVKGLTAEFCVLLLVKRPRHAAETGSARSGCGKNLGAST
ncbi:MAG: hypothetical protein U1E61_18535, partial [Bradyrhizobium sp.]